MSFIHNHTHTHTLIFLHNLCPCKDSVESPDIYDDIFTTSLKFIQLTSFLHNFPEIIEKKSITFRNINFFFHHTLELSDIAMSLHLHRRHIGYSTYKRRQKKSSMKTTDLERFVERRISGVRFSSFMVCQDRSNHNQSRNVLFT